MKKAILSVLTTGTFVSPFVMAGPQDPSKLTYLQKLRVVEAIRVLESHHIIKGDVNQCFRVDDDILDLLEETGNLHQEGNRAAAICPDKSK